MGNFMTRVDLGEEIPPEALEHILVGAAQDLGWRARTREKYTREYHRSEEVQKYLHTEVLLRGLFLPAARVVFYRDKPTNDYIKIDSGNYLFSGIATDREVRRYLQAVSQRINAMEESRPSWKVLAGTI